MVRDLVAGDVPVGDEGEVGVVDGVVVGHLGRAAVGILTVGEELVDGVEGVALDGIVGSKDDELRDYRLRANVSLVYGG